ncbi:MAG: glycoside hydrolase family 127 protein [Cyclobacteriaceae bacterium]|nr:glycoside hydrolase family 127 protein [Cyclobacteriaceae bacterium]
MMKSFFLILILTTNFAFAQSKNDKYRVLPVGAIKPTGWLKEQMQKDFNGFVSALPKLAPVLFQDSIYGKDRLKRNTAAKELGNLKEGDAEGEDQYKWWNSETQSNWRDGFYRHAILLGDSAGIQEMKKDVGYILSTQDTDGYLGIYDEELRYNFTSENGELWAKTTLLRALLAYYEFSKDEVILRKIELAVQETMIRYPEETSSPFNTGTNFNGGVSHGLMFTDILVKLYTLTGNAGYLRYANFLYLDYSNTIQSESDAQLQHLQDAKRPLYAHGVHTYEHLRSLLAAARYRQDSTLNSSLKLFENKIVKVVTQTGGAIGDEWIAGRVADPTTTGYEYCSLHELVNSWAHLLVNSGEKHYADEIEKIFYNAAQGSRHPTLSSIAYLKTDNSFEMLGTKNGEQEPNRKQTRYKYSAVHQDVAVCCSPNAGRIAPYFLQHAWLMQGTDTLVVSLLTPSKVQVPIYGNVFTIENKTNYPYDTDFTFEMNSKESVSVTLKIRKPNWATSVVCNDAYFSDGQYLYFNKKIIGTVSLRVKFKTRSIVEQSKQHVIFKHGVLVFALPINATEEKGQTYAQGYTDLYYQPLFKQNYSYAGNRKARFKNGRIQVKLLNEQTKKFEKVYLVPLSKTILRQVTF